MREGFEDRRDAGRRLAALLRGRSGGAGDLVLALPRGGVPVAAEVAEALDLPLDVLVVRKLGLPRQPELALGAIASGGVLVLNRDVVAAWHVTESEIDAVRRAELAELQRREALYRGGAAAAEVAGRTAIVVDDGIATGATMRAALRSLRARRPGRIVVAVPVAPPRAREDVGILADDYVCLLEPARFEAVGQFYRDFGQTGDDEVRELLAHRRGAASFTASGPHAQEHGS